MNYPAFSELDADALTHSRRLAELIGAEIACSHGWIGFDRFMHLALYAPGLGYYSGGATKLGAAGDFVTAPELSSLYSRTLARQIGAILSLSAGDVLELGAGSGRMAEDMLRALDEAGSLPGRYLILEVSAELAERQRRRLLALPARLSSRVAWLQRLPNVFRGAVVCNEVLDALPVHLVSWDGSGIRERGVARSSEQFVWDERPMTEGELLAVARRLSPPPPYRSELARAAPALVAAIGGILECGALLVIDYGFGEGEYYHPQRNRGTLMCHFQHRAHDDPFFLPGLQDITSHVDFTALTRAGTQAGLDLLGYTTQAHFLVNLGITELMARTSAEDAAAYLPLAAQAQKLLSPAEMGELYKVIALGRGIDGVLEGFRSGDMGRLL